jgi:hypothetical protein
MAETKMNVKPLLALCRVLFASPAHHGETKVVLANKTTLKRIAEAFGQKGTGLVCGIPLQEMKGLKTGSYFVGVRIDETD